MTDAPDASDAGRLDLPALRGRPARWVTVGIAILVGVFLLVALRNNWQAVREDLSRLSWFDLAFAGMAGAAASAFTGLAWMTVLAGLGAALPPHDAFTVHFAGQLGKYVPGSVWTAMIQAEMGRRHRVNRSTMVTAYLFALVLAVATGSLLAFLILLGDHPSSLVVPSVVASVGGGALIILAYDARLLNRLLRWLGNKTGRSLPQVHPSGRSTLEASALIVVGWILFGLHIFAIARPLGVGSSQIVSLVGAFALAFVAGLLVVPLPAGAGVRDVVLTLVLAGSIGRPSALVVSFLSRFVLLLTDVALAGAFGVRRAARTVRAGGDQEAG